MLTLTFPFPRSWISTTEWHYLLGMAMRHILPMRIDAHLYAHICEYSRIIRIRMAIPTTYLALGSHDHIPTP